MRRSDAAQYFEALTTTTSTSGLTVASFDFATKPPPVAPFVEHKDGDLVAPWSDVGHREVGAERALLHVLDGPASLPRLQPARSSPGTSRRSRLPHR